MDLWRPPQDQPAAFGWFHPLLRAAAEDDHGLLAGSLDDVVLRGRADRDGKPSVWIYRLPDGRDLAVDVSGQAYRYVATPRGRSAGRFERIPLTRALRSPQHTHPAGTTSGARAPAEAAGTAEAGGGRRRRFGHLTVIDGGRAAS